MAASIAGKIAFGERAGLLVRKIGKGFGYFEESPLIKGKLTATVNGFSLNASQFIGQGETEKLRNLIGYMARPPLALDRLSQNEDGLLVYTLKNRWSDGTKAIILSPQEMIEKIIALIPLPRSHTVLYSGCFASHHHLRPKIIKRPGVKKGFVQETDGETTKVVKLSWSKLLGKVFKLDLTICPKCGEGKIRFVAMIRESAVIEKILVHLGLLAQPPPIASPRWSQIGLYDY